MLLVGCGFTLQNMRVILQHPAYIAIQEKITAQVVGGVM